MVLLRQHGLPEELSLIDLYALVDHVDHIAEQRRIKSRAADLQRKQSELRELDLRMTSLLDDADAEFAPYRVLTCGTYCPSSKESKGTATRIIRS